MAQPSPVRWLAPIGLVAFFIALIVLLGGGGDEGGERSGRAGEPPAATRTQESGKGSRRQKKFHTVKLGDTPSSIAAEHELSLATIESLNPRLDPQTMNIGDRIRLRR